MDYSPISLKVKRYCMDHQELQKRKLEKLQKIKHRYGQRKGLLYKLFAIKYYSTEAKAPEQIDFGNIYLQPSAAYVANTFVRDPENDKLTYGWEILPKPAKLNEGGDFEQRPVSMRLPVGSDGLLKMKVPQKEGAYRLFAMLVMAIII